MVKHLLLLLLFSTPLAATLPQKVVICGVGKTVAPFFPVMKENIERIGALFADYRVIVYENDSTDETPLLFHDWARQNHKVLAISEQVSDEEFAKSCVNREIHGWFYRPERIARARNTVLDLALSPTYADFSYLIWVDLDFTTPFSLHAIEEVFTTTTPWDGVFANGLDQNNNYFDWYAFRDATYPIGAELLGDSWWSIKKNLTLRPGDPWHPVYSAFGGLGIYKKSSIEGCRYSAIVTPEMERVYQTILEETKENRLTRSYLAQKKDILYLARINSPSPHLPKRQEAHLGVLLSDRPTPLIWRMNSGVCQYPSTCEHVAFHASMRARGYTKLYIHPNLILRYKR